MFKSEIEEEVPQDFFKLNSNSACVLAIVYPKSLLLLLLLKISKCSMFFNAESILLKLLPDTLLILFLLSLFFLVKICVWFLFRMQCYQLFCH